MEAMLKKKGRMTCRVIVNRISLIFGQKKNQFRVVFSTIF